MSEAGSMVCLVDPEEPCTDENCDSCDTYPSASGPVDICTQDCVADDDCNSFGCDGTNCAVCYEGYCRWECDTRPFEDECRVGWFCESGHCLPQAG